MIFNVADLKKLIQDLDDDTIVQVDDGGAYYAIDDAEVTYNQKTNKHPELYLHVQKLFN
jgi:hypothetical protein